ncbi:MAG: hypothetical protein R3C26_05840 [Calditrichia bacterium]
MNSNKNVTALFMPYSGGGEPGHLKKSSVAVAADRTLFPPPAASPL